MQKTLASLLLTICVSLLGIPLAYLVGQRSAHDEAERRVNEERARAVSERQALLAELRAGLASKLAEPIAQKPPAPVVSIEPVAPPAIPVNAQSAPQIAQPEPEPAPTVDNLAKAPDAVPAAVEAQSGANALAEAPLKSVLPPPTPIARETFNAIALGAAYAEIAQRFGRDGAPALTMEDAHGSTTREYVWQWPADGRTRRITMRFIDGQLTEKSWRD